MLNPTLILPLVLLLPAGRVLAGPPRNLALGKPYRLDPRPNYPYCTDPGDLRQLTDGILSKGYFWTQKETVGWSRAGLVLVTIDLGKVEAVGGLSFRTAFGTAGVHPPEAVFVFAGKDRRSFHYLGELISADDSAGGPPPDGPYRVHTYKTSRIRGSGRFLLLVVVPRGPFVFCDEIRVFPGKGGEPPGKPVRDPRSWVKGRLAALAFRHRLEADLERILRSAARAGGGLGRALASRAGILEARIPREAGDLPGDFRSVVPATPFHEKILALHAPVLRGLGFSGLTVWHTDRYAPLDYLAVPPKAPLPRLDVSLMRREYRAEVLNLTNPTEKALDARISFRGLPGGPRPAWISVHQVLYMDTQSRKPVADPLPRAGASGGAWVVRVPAGLTRQVWFTFHPRETPPGDYRGTIEIGFPGGTRRVPLQVRLSRLAFPSRPRLHLVMWDYAHDPPAYDVTPGNRAAALEDMRAHFVDAPWARRQVLPWPGREDFDDRDRLKAPLDFRAFDRWVKLRPEARIYGVFLSVGKGAFAGYPPGSPRFVRRLRAWTRAFADHLRRIHLPPSRLAFHVLDEPHDKARDAVILAWARAVKSACPSILIWEDPTHRRPEVQGLKEMFLSCDVLCPNLGIFCSSTRADRRFYLDLVRKGKRKLWFYQCAGPARELDPYAYHRLQAWYCWKYGAVGSGFWAYGDGGGSPWNVYVASRTSYSPVYLGREGVVDGKHFEALREGLEDYEYLALLRDKLRASRDPGFRKEAETLLAEAVKRVVPSCRRRNLSWGASKDYSAADRIRLRILELLERSP